MRNLILTLLLSIGLSSCEKDVTIKNPDYKIYLSDLEYQRIHNEHHQDIKQIHCKFCKIIKQ